MRISVLERRQGSSGNIWIRLHGQDVLPDFPGEVLVNWGLSPASWFQRGLRYPDGPSPLVLNLPHHVANCVDKVSMLGELRERGIYTPRILAVGNMAVIKHQYHRGGRGMVLLDMDKYIEEFIPVDKEYRVDVVGDATLVREKKEGWGYIRNHRYGWMFRFARDYPPELPDIAKQAVRALSLDFGACDIGLSGQDRLVVFEVNSAPRITAPMATNWWAEHLVQYIERRINERRNG